MSINLSKRKHWLSVNTTVFFLINQFQLLPYLINLKDNVVGVVNFLGKYFIVFKLVLTAGVVVVAVLIFEVLILLNLNIMNIQYI